MVHRDKMLLAGLVCECGSSQKANYQIIQNCWKSFNFQLWKINNRIEKDDWEKFGIIFQSVPKSGYKYMPAVEIADSNNLPDCFDIIEIPAIEYLVFYHHGKIEELKNTYSKLYKEILPTIKANILTEDQCGLKHIERYDNRFHWYRADSVIEIMIPNKLL